MHLLPALLLALSVWANATRSLNVHAVEFGLLCLVLAVALYDKRQNIKQGVSPADHWLLYAFGIYAISLALSPFLSEAPYYSIIGATQQLMLPLGFFFALLPAVRQGTWLRGSNAMAFAATGVLLSIWGITDFYLALARSFAPVAWSVEHARSSGHDLDFNDFGETLNVLSIAAAGACLQSSGKIVPWVLLALFSLGVATAQSRGVVAAQVCVMPFLFWAIWPDRRARIKLSLCVATAIGSVMIVHASLLPFPDQSRDAVGDSRSTECRLLMWQSTLAAWKAEGKLWGTGLATYKQVYPEYRNPRETCSSGDEAHGDYLQRLLESGPLSLVLLLVIAPLVSARTLVRARRIQQPDRRIEAACFAAAAFAIALHAAVNFVYEDDVLVLMAGLCIGRAVSIESVQGALVKSPNSGLAMALRPLVVAVMLFYLLSTCLDAEVVSRLTKKGTNSSADRDLGRFANLAESLAPWDPFPHLFLNTVYNSKTDSTPGPAKDFKVLFAYRETQQWIRYNRHSALAWVRLSELLDADPTLDPQMTPQRALAIALVYDPSDIKIRMGLAREMLLDHKDKESCGVLEEGRDWLAMQPLSRTQMMAELVDLGEHTCASYESPQDRETWNQLGLWVRLGSFD